MIFIRRISKEEAEQVVRFFELNPTRATCVVGLGSADTMIEHRREDIAKLKRIAGEPAETSPAAAALTDGCTVKVNDTCFVVECRGKTGKVKGNPPYPSNMPLVEVDGLTHTLPAEDLEKL